ncbi:hypothetical protein FNV43_RR25706 [Rhamnella rubrinervis]|uniref:DUF1262 family protein n=1 Tax=Rhamnella rubrinervis TaxID=2594499 RepID=A0A8K0GN51_9ROSA|nr:hypothetical protein FNV43_RR25706 [Rhamnella rubrinervis]
MYVTRPLSLYRRSPECLSLPPPEGPNSGYLVLFDEESETTTCFGLCKETSIRDLPFPQNKDLIISHTITRASDTGPQKSTDYDYVVLIPVLNQPLSSNRYYVMRRRGRHKGEASTSSKEEDVTTCLCCRFINDAKPRPFDPSDEYQQVEIIHKKHGRFTAKSTVPDGHPPLYLRRKYWNVSMSTPRSYELHEAPGIDPSLRKRLPEFNIPFSATNELVSSETVVVGKWYCPFMFVHDQELKLKDQLKTSMFYEVTLEQRWQKIFSCDNYNSDHKGQSNVIHVDVCVEKEQVFIGGRFAAVVGDAKNAISDGVMWFTSREDNNRRVGLSMLVAERMKWEEERVGCRVGLDGNESSQVKVERVEEYGGAGRWSKFGCFVLVERFVFKRMDATILLTYDFKHTHQIRCKWE